MPEEFIEFLERRYNETAEPKNLTLLYASGISDSKDKGLNRLDKEGLLKRVIAGHWGMTPRLQKLAVADKIEAYNFPQGVLSHMSRDIAAGNPLTITSVGIGTFVDPRLEGGKVNFITTEDMVEVVNFDGFQVCSVKDIEDISDQVEAILSPLGQKVNVIVNYDNFFIIKDLVDAYVDMVKSVVSRYYEKVIRYTTSAFIRMKVGERLKERGIAPHIYESREDARKSSIITGKCRKGRFYWIYCFYSNLKYI